MAKKSKTKAKKSKTKPAKKKTAKRAAAKAKPAKAKKSKKSKKTKKPVKAAKKIAKKPAKKAVKKKRQTVGEGSYEATRAFDKAQAGFVKANKDKIPSLGKAAEAALEGSEGNSLRDAEAAAAGRSRDTF